MKRVFIFIGLALFLSQGLTAKETLRVQKQDLNCQKLIGLLAPRLSDSTVFLSSEAKGSAWVVLKRSHSSPEKHRGPYADYEVYRLAGDAVQRAGQFTTAEEFESDRSFNRRYVFEKTAEGDVRIWESRRTHIDGQPD